MHYLIADLCPSTDEQLNTLLEEDEGQTRWRSSWRSRLGWLAGFSEAPAGQTWNCTEKLHLSPLMSEYQPSCSKEICLPCSSSVNTSKRCISNS